MNDRLARAEQLLARHRCPCGSGGSMACDEDCPGDTTTSEVTDAFALIIEELREMRQLLAGASRPKGD